MDPTTSHPRATQSHGHDDTRHPKRVNPTRDRLSELPDLALAHIFSHLFLEEAARTTLLSKRFNSVWNSVDSVHLSDQHAGKPAAFFVSFVDSALPLLRRREIDKFSLSVDYNSEYSHSVNEWVKFATEKRVKSLNLNLSNNNFHNGSPRREYTIPDFISTNLRLEVLVTSCCKFPEDSNIFWKSLRVLSLTWVKTDDHAVSSILRQCEVLERLELRNWTGFSKLKVESRSLRVLRIVEERRPMYEFDMGSDAVLEITGPKLVTLEVSGRLYRTRVRVSDVGSLVCAVMDFDVRFDKRGWTSLVVYVDIAKEVLESLCLVNSLTVGGWFLKVLSPCELYNISSPWSERRSLTLCIPILKWDHLGIASMLHSSPCLQNLVLKLSYCSDTCRLEHSKKGRISHNDDEEDYYWKSRTTMSRCPLLHLKTVKVIGFQVSCRSIRPLFQFLQFLLINSKVLEEIVIQASRYVTREALDEALKLVAIPTASPDALVKFEPPHLWIDPLHMCQQAAP